MTGLIPALLPAQLKLRTLCVSPVACAAHSGFIAGSIETCYLVCIQVCGMEAHSGFIAGSIETLYTRRRMTATIAGLIPALLPAQLKRLVHMALRRNII